MLERRRDTAIALLQSNPEFARETGAAVSIGLLEDLQDAGPFAPIFRDARAPEPTVDWLGKAERATSGDQGRGG